MKIKKVIVDEMPKMCDDCYLSGRYHPGNLYCTIKADEIPDDILRPSWCPLEVETDANPRISALETEIAKNNLEHAQYNLKLYNRIAYLEDKLRWRPVSDGNLPDPYQEVEFHDTVTDSVMIGNHAMGIPQWASDSGLYFHGDNYERIDKWRPIPEFEVKNE